MSISKILDENWEFPIIRRYFKLFGVWVIDSKNKYLGDPLFRSELDIVFLQIVFTAFLVVLVALHLSYLNFASFVIVASIGTLAFGHLISRVTLAPTRNALKYQKRFISDVAHELRTPLSVIKTNCEVTLLDPKVDINIQKMIKSNIEELDRTSQIINNLLTFNNMARPERLSFSSVDMGLIVDSSVKKLRDLARSKQIELTVRKIQPYMVWGNATALEQVIINILKNAINFTPTHGFVSLILEPDYQGNVSCIVKDSGVGISREDLVHIFEPFYRAERSRNRMSGSSGLGLTIVSEIIKLHSGRITIKSLLNHGTTAIIKIPFSKNVSQSIRPVVSDEVSIDFSKRL